MDNKKLTIGAAALTALVISAGLAASSFAYQGDPSIKGSNCTSERHEAMTAALEANDYNAWVKARGDAGHGRMMGLVNADNFKLFAEMRKARLAGDTAKINEIRAKLGLGQGSMMKDKDGHRGGCQGFDNGGKDRRGSGVRG